MFLCISATRTGSHLELSSIGVEGVLAPGTSSVKRVEGVLHFGD